MQATAAPRRSPAARPQRDIDPLPVAETTELPLEALTPTERDTFFGNVFADTMQAVPDAPSLRHGHHWPGQNVIELPLEALTPTERDTFFGNVFADTVHTDLAS